MSPQVTPDFDGVMTTPAPASHSAGFLKQPTIDGARVHVHAGDEHTPAALGWPLHEGTYSSTEKKSKPSLPEIMITLLDPLILRPPPPAAHRSLGRPARTSRPQPVHPAADPP